MTFLPWCFCLGASWLRTRTLETMIQNKTFHLYIVLVVVFVPVIQSWLLQIHKKWFGSVIGRGICIPMFIATLFTISKITESTLLSISGWIDKYIHSGLLFRHKKWNSVICSRMVETRRDYAKWEGQKDNHIGSHCYVKNKQMISKNWRLVTNRSWEECRGGRNAERIVGVYHEK